MLIRKPGKTVGAYAKPACVRPRARWSEFESAQKSGISAERQAAMDALDVERAAVAADAARIANQLVREAGEEVRRLVREALILAIVLALVVLGAPFAACYFVGRAHRSNPSRVAR